MAKIVLHLKPGDIGRNLNGLHLQLYQHLAQMSAAAGIDLVIRQRDADIRVGTRTVADGRFDDGNLHIIDDRALHMPNVLNAGAAYFWQFWHLDSCGVKGFSSIGQTDFDPQRVPRHRAQTFFDNLRHRYVVRRQSKYRQRQDRVVLPKDAIAVFFQGRHPMASGASRISDIEMLHLVLSQSGTVPVVVKPHPLSSDIADLEQLTNMAAQVNRLHVTDANVHDILSRSRVSVSMNSTVALEGFLHQKPAILFGRADFHHVCSTVGPDCTFQQALATEAGQQRDFAAFLFWYFFQQCLSLGSGRLDDRIWQIFEQAGFDRSRFFN